MIKSLGTLIFNLGNRHPRLLIVDDQPINIRLIREIFPPEYNIFMATSGEQALKICEQSQPDLILLDVVMPKMDGLQLCRLLKKNPVTHDIPIIFVTGLQSFDEETACWDAGCVDFVMKPINPVTLRNRVNVHLALKLQTELLRSLALIDGLTGIANRRSFDERIEMEFSRVKRTKQSLAVLMIDVDLFKQYNDKYGHPAGDQCLRNIAMLLKSNLNRPADFVARYGGEEFVCLLPETNEYGAKRIGEKLRCAVEHLGLENAKSTVVPVITVSIGIAVYPDTPSLSCNDLVEAADRQLYEAKRKGRNQVCIGTP